MLVYKYTMDRPFTKVREASIIIGIKGNCLIMSDNYDKADLSININLPYSL